MNVLSPTAQPSSIVMYAMLVMLVDLLRCGIIPNLVYQNQYFSYTYNLPSHPKKYLKHTHNVHNK
jgi:hypothetical protein